MWIVVVSSSEKAYGTFETLELAEIWVQRNVNKKSITKYYYLSKPIGLDSF